MLFEESKFYGEILLMFVTIIVTIMIVSGG